MSYIKEFSPAVIEAIGYYVYLLIDPETDKIFYIGKGNGNRIFSHIKAAFLTNGPGEKLDKIREFHVKGLSVKLVIHRHGLTEKEAIEVEAALIEFAGIEGLTNLVHGHDSTTRGKMTVAEIIARYDAPIVTIQEPGILITVNRLYQRGMSGEALYEITRGNWCVGERRHKAKYAFSVYNGIIREVYEIKGWSPVTARNPDQKQQARWRFEGTVAQNLRHYVNSSIASSVSKGAQNPIRYVNC